MLLREYNHKWEYQRYLWIGVPLKTGNVLYERIDGWQGVPVSVGIQFICNPNMTLARGGRNRGVDKVKENENYGGN